MRYRDESLPFTADWFAWFILRHYTCSHARLIYITESGFCPLHLDPQHVF